MPDHRRVSAPLHAGLPVLAALVLLLADVAPSRAQSLTSGQVAGTVRDSAGMALPDVAVTLVDRTTGARREHTTARGGSFRFTLLLPGGYDLLVERFGYRPALIERVPVRSGAVRTVHVVLKGGAGGVDSTVFRGAPTGGSGLALSGEGAADDLAALASVSGLAAEAGQTLPLASGDLEAEGLPGVAGGAQAIDGMIRQGARHGRVPGAALDGLPFPDGSLRAVEPLTYSFDVERPMGGSGVLAAFAVPGPRALAARVSADAGPDGQRGVLTLSGPIVRDTAQFTLGVAARRLTPELPVPWTADTIGAAAVGIARDSFNTDLSAYQRPHVPTVQVFGAFGRLDWQVARDHRVSAHAAAATGAFDDPDLGPAVPAALGTRLDTRDLTLGAALASVLNTSVGSEARVALDVGQRTYDGAGLARTLVLGGGLAAGTAELQPGTFKRTTLRLQETMHYTRDRALFKAGLGLTLDRHDRTYADARAGTFYFSDTTALATLTGAFRQLVGTVPAATFQTTTIAFFAQALLRPTDALDVQFGLRIDEQRLPVTEIRRNVPWLQATGVDNSIVPDRARQISPRASFAWALGREGRWVLQGGAGLFSDPDDPDLLAEAITRSVGAQVRRGAGALGRWPQVPDSTVAAVQGETITLLGPDHRPPRTGRVALGLGGALGGLTVRLGGTYRHTDYLPLRRDLNLFTAPSARDQYGRPVYGTLVQTGGILTAAPGTNRRFAAFDAVNVLDPAGASDYWGLTLGLEREVSRGVSLVAHYTYSSTRDNWYGARAGLTDAAILPFTDSTSLRTWTKGASDFDVPHRLVLGTELRFAGRAGLRLAMLYRYQSGYPFTPGFRDGVDANGDGSDRNDPAFVTDTVQGAGDVIAANDCLRSQVGRMAERNSCREPSTGQLDVRLGARLGRLGGGRSEIYVDGIGLARTGGDIIDRALYLVDGTRSLSVNPATNITTVPLVANPNFGRALVRRTPSAAWRVGVRVSF